MNTIKKISVSIFAVVMSVVMTVMLSSCAEEVLKPRQISVEGVTYFIDYMNQEATAIGLSDMDNVPSEIYIADNVKGADGVIFPVTAIATKAFIDVNSSTLIMGRHVAEIGHSAFKYSDIKFIWITGMTLPEATEDIFDASLYESATLTIMSGTRLTYPWTNFKNVETAYYLQSDDSFCRIP